MGLGVAGPYIYIHFIAGPPKPKLTLPKSKTTPPSSPGTATLTGTWSVTSSSKAGYRVQEVLLGQNETAVGRTPDVSGTLVLEGTVLRSARFSVPLATVVSDQSERNAEFNGSIMDVARYPTATFDLTSPVSLGQLPPPDKIVTTTARGDLTMHGVTHSLSLRISAEQTGTSIWVLAGRDDRLRRLAHPQPEHRWVRHDGEPRNARGPVAPRARCRPDDHDDHGPQTGPAR